MSANLFNPSFYRAANSDLSSFSDAQALSHFQTYGLDEGVPSHRLSLLTFTDQVTQI